MKILIIRSIVAALLASSLAVIAQGCGGGGSDSTASTTNTTVTTSSRSRAEFVKLANGICKRARVHLIYEMGEYIKTHEGEGKKTPTLPDAFRVVAIPKFPGQIEEIRSLGAPKGDEQQVEAFLAAMQQTVNAPPKLTFKKLRLEGALAQKYGLTDCVYAS
jgi:hypothetical protein